MMKIIMFNMMTMMTIVLNDNDGNSENDNDGNSENDDGDDDDNHG